MIFYYCLAPHHFASLHSLRLALSDTMPFTGANIEQDRERGAKEVASPSWSPSEQRAKEVASPPWSPSERIPRTRSERRCERRQRLRNTALSDECSLEPRFQLQRLVLVIREIRPRHRRIHITDIALILDISLRLAVYSRDTIFKY